MGGRVVKNSALWFIISIGVVSLFSDMTYEGARSISGQYLAILGASGVVVGTVAGFGELIGYGVRLFSGMYADRTGRYWMMAFLGYSVNLLAVPLLALAGNWPTAAVLLSLERFGKALRNPPRDAMLSYASKQSGRGWGFGLHHVMDRTGAVLGPLVMAAILFYRDNYQLAFAVLLIPALCALAALTLSRWAFPHPKDLEVAGPDLHTKGLSRQFWTYVAGASLVAAGFVDFPLIAYHFHKSSLMTEVWIPVFFACAMAADGLSGLVLGRIYDEKGMSVLVYTTLLCACGTPLAFLGGFYVAFFGVVLWGIGMGLQASVMHAIVANIVHRDMRGTAYGFFNLCFGIAWFLGSALMGAFYDVSMVYLIAFSVLAQIAAIPVFVAARTQT